MIQKVQVCVGWPALLMFSPVFLSPDDNLSEDDINECEKEDPLHEDDRVPHPDSGKKEVKKRKKPVSGVR